MIYKDDPNDNSYMVGRVLWEACPKSNPKRVLVFVIVISLLALSIPIGMREVDGAPTGWHEGTISDPIIFSGYCNGAVDKEGKKHVIIWDGFSPFFQYGVSEGGGFSLTKIDRFDHNYYDHNEPRLALDGNDEPHIVYSDQGRLIYTTASDDSWTNTSLEWVGHASCPEIAADSTGKAHIVFWDPIGRKVHYINNAEGPWEEVKNWTTDLEDRSTTRSFCSIDLGPDDRPHICFLNGSGPTYLTYATWNSSSWEQTELNESAGVWDVGDIVVDRNGAVHLVYYTSSAITREDEMHYSKKLDGMWTDQVVQITPAAGGYYGYYPSMGGIAVDTVGTLHICYSMVIPVIEDMWYHVYYMRIDQGGSSITSISGEARYPSVGIGPDDQPTVFFTKLGKSINYITLDDVPIPTLPSEPSSFQARGGEGMAGLTWQPPKNDGGTNVTGYRIYRSTTPGVYGQTIATEGNTVLSYRDEGLQDGQKFYYRISALNAMGEGEVSDEQIVTVSSLSGTPPDGVYLHLTSEEGVYTIHWSMLGDGGSPIKGFKIYGSLSSSRPALIAEVGPTVTEYQALNLTMLVDPEEWMAVYFWVVAYNEVGDGPMQSTPMRAPQHESPTENTWVPVMVGSIALMVVLISFLLIRRRNGR
jgi:hypothetical protein